MRKTLLFLWVAVLGMCLPVSAAVVYHLNPVSFEDGNLPAGWSQVNEQGSVNWAVEGGEGVSLTNPKDAASGLYRVAARNTTSQKEGFVTKLVTPVFDVSSATNPQVAFSYANVANSSGVFDTLVVYYRTAESAQWQLLKQYVEAKSFWTREAVSLVAYAGVSTYQLAFEVRDAGGRGVVLDSICVTQPSQCQNITYQTVETWKDSAFIEFNGTPLYDVIISPVALNPDTVAVASFVAHNSADNFVEVGDLESYTLYYVYTRSTCDDNASGYTEWVATSFRTYMRAALPFTENFNGSSSSNSYVQAAGWTVGSGAKDLVAPYVLQGSEKSMQIYSVDSTAFLVFGGSQSVSPAAIAANSTVYAASPELLGDLSKCEVSFWGTVGNNIYNGVVDYAAELTVGVMTDAADYSTFTALKTVKVDHAAQFKHFSVSLAGAPAGAKHVALVSKAAKQNVFFVDNFEVKEVTVATATDVKVTNLLPNGFKVSADLHGASSWNLKVAKVYSRNPETIADSLLLVDQSGLTGADYTVNSLASLAGQTVVVYVQAAGGAWSFPATVRVPSARPAPYVLTFNAGAKTIALSGLGNEIHSLVGDASADVFFPLRSGENLYPAISQSKPLFDSAHLVLNGIDNYFVLPYVESFDSLELVFRLSSGGASTAGQSCVAVGTMTDPYDLSTFVQLGTFEGLAGSYAKCSQDLSAIKQAGYVAVRALKPANASNVGSSNLIDNLALQKYNPCREAANIKAAATASKVLVSWDANGMQKWQVKVYADAKKANLLVDSVVTVDSLLLTNLNGETTYYYSVQTICGADTLLTEDLFSFTTSVGLPWKPVFTKSMPQGWAQYSILDSLVYAGEELESHYNEWSFVSSPFSGDKDYCARIEYYSNGNEWLVSPVISLEDNASEGVQMSFDAALTKYNSYNNRDDNSQIFKVIISDDGGKSWKAANATVWNNLGTGDFVMKELSEEKFTRFNIDLSAYVGKKIVVAFYAEFQYGSYDAYLYVKNVSVDRFDPNCGGIKALSAVATGTNSALVNWSLFGTPSAPQIHLDAKSEDGTVVYEGLVAENPYTLTGLEAGARYNLWAYQSCNPAGDTLTASFRTECAAIAIADFGTETFSNGADALGCWLVGINDTTGVGDRQLTAPSVVKDRKYGQVLQINKPRNYKSSYSGEYNYGNEYFAVLPLLEVDSINKYQILFDACSYTTGTSDTANVKQFEVGIMTDPADFSTFIVIDTVRVQYAADSLHMKRLVVGFDAYDGDDLGEFGKYVAFRASAPFGYSVQAYIDNISFETVSGCHQVTNLTCTGTTSSTASLTWSQKGAANYELLVSDHIGRPDTITEPVFDQVITGTSATIEALNPSTEYYAYVRSICGEGDSAAWSGVTIFSTAFGIPFAEDFDAMEGAYQTTSWKTYDQSVPSDSVFSTDAFSVSSYSTDMSIQEVDADITGMSGKAASVEVYTTGSAGFLQSPAIDMTSVAPGSAGLELSFRLARVDYYGGEPEQTTSEFFRLYISEDGGKSFRASNSYEWNGVGTGDYNVNDIGLDAKRWCVDISNYAGKSVAFGFYFNATAYETDSYFYLDSVAVQAYDNSCVGVKRLQASVADTTAVVRWSTTDQSKAIVELAIDKNFADVLLTDSTAADSLVLHNLAYGATYYVRVHSACGSEASATSFTTGHALAYSENFEASASYPAGWENFRGNPLTDTLQTASDGWNVISNSACGLTTNHLAASAYNSNYYGLIRKTIVSPEVLLNANAGDSVVLSFKAGLNANYSGTGAAPAKNIVGHTFLVGVSTDGGKTWQADPSAIWGPDSLAAQKFSTLLPSAQELTVNLTKYAGQKVRICFYHGVDSISPVISTQTPYIHLDDVKIAAINPNCQSPVVQASACADSIFLSWNGAASDTYEAQLSLAASFAKVAAELTVTDSVCAFSNLLSSTPYYVRVRRVCDESNNSAWSDVVNIRTYDAIPFVEPLRTDPESWSHMVGAPDEIFSGSALTQNNSYYDWWLTKNGAFGVEHMAVEIGDGTTDLWLMSPVIDASKSEALELSFDMALTAYGSSSAPSSSAGQRVYVCVSTDGGKSWTRDNSFLWSDEKADTAVYASLKAVPAAGKTFFVDFDAFAGVRNLRFAFVIEDKGSKDNMLHVANVSLSEAVTTCFGIESVSLINVTKTTAKFALNGQDTTCLAYQYACVPAGSALAAAEVHTSVADTITLSGLKASTTYDVYARSICAVGDTSAWYMASFATVNGVPYFDALSQKGQWSYYYGTVSSVMAGTEKLQPVPYTGYGWEIQSAEAIAGITGSHAYTEVYNYYDWWLVSPSIDLSDNVGQNLQLSFDFGVNSAYASRGYDVDDSSLQQLYVLVSTDDGKTWPAANSFIVGETDDANTSIVACEEEAQLIEVMLNRYAGQSIRLAFVASSSDPDADNAFHLANVEIDTISGNLCLGVSKLQMAEVGTSSAKVMVVTDNVNDVKYEYAYGETGFALASATTHTSDSSVIVLSGLTPGSDYQVYVRIICGESDTTAWSKAASFSTGCLGSAKDTYNFDDEDDRYVLYSSQEYDFSYNLVTTEHTMQNCIQAYGVTDASGYYTYYYYPEVVDNSGDYTYAYSETGALRLSSSSEDAYSYAVLPAMTGLDSLRILFKGRAGYVYDDYGDLYMETANENYARSIRVGVMTDPANKSTFTELATFTVDAVESDPADDPEGTNYWRDYSVNLRSGKGEYVVFMSDFDDDNYFFIDDVSFAPAVKCQAPASAPEVKASHNAVLARWIDMGVNTYELQIDSVGGSAPRSIVVKDTTLCLIDSLEAGVSYTVKMRAICDSVNSSAWSPVATISTQVVMDVPYETDFSTSTGWSGASLSAADLFAGKIPNIKKGSRWEITDDLYYNDGLTLPVAGISYSNYYGVAYNHWLFSPVVDLSSVEAGTPADLSFMAYLQYYYGGEPDDVDESSLLMVAVSTDGGITWSSANTTVWCDDEEVEADHSFSAIEYLGSRYTIDLSAYVGQYIQLGFFASVGSTYESNVLYLDDIRVRTLNANCMGATEVTVKDQKVDGAVVNFKHTSGALLYELEVSESNDFATLTVHDTLTATVDSLKGLAMATDYYVRVRQLCGEDGESVWSDVVSFRTSYGLPFSEDFDNAIPKDWQKLSGALFAGTASASGYYSWSSSSDSAAGFDTYHVYAYAYSSSNYYLNSLITPVIELNNKPGNGVELSFEMGLTNSYNGTTSPAQDVCDGRAFYVAVSTDGGRTWSRDKSFVWGTANGVPMGTYESIPGTAQRYSVDLSEYAGQKVMLAFFHDPSGGTSSGETYIQMDNVLVREYNMNCQGVDSVKVSNIGLNEADLRFVYKAGVRAAEAEVSTDAAFQNVVAQHSFTADSLWHITGLTASSKYYVRIKQLCGAGEESAYETISFATAQGIPYADNLSSTTLPTDWSTYNYAVGSTLQFADSVFTPSSYGRWMASAADASINGYHFKTEVYYTCEKWLVSPIIDMTPNVGDGLMMTMDLAFRPYWGSDLDERNQGVDDRFMVVVSEDAGKTWNIAKNATIWDNDSANNASGATRSYNEIPMTAKNYRINMTGYAGKKIRLGFYAESTTSNADNYFNVGNIRINKVKNTTVFRDTICEGEPYEGYGFQIEASDLQVGLNGFDRYFPAVDSLHTDSMVILTVFVNAKPAVTELRDLICEGEAYQKDGFNIAKPTTGDHYLHLTSAGGCDSTVVLHLMVSPTAYTDTTIYACKSEGYTFGGKTYYSDVVLGDTLTSASGCDSIVRIIVKISAEERDSTVIRTAICEGSTYDVAPFEGLSVQGTYKATATSIYGCDSTVVLKLLVAKDGAVYDTIRIEELPYIYEDETFLTKATKIGDYQHDVNVGNCGKVTIHIHVTDGTGLRDLDGENAGAVKFIYQEKVYIRYKGVIYNSVGQRVTLNEE